MERKSHKFDRLVIKIDRSVIKMRNYQNKLTKNNIFIDNLRNHGIIRLIIDELEKYVVLTLKNWGGGVQICT